MDVMSVESCVQAVIGAYRDASKLTQRLKDKQKTSEEFIFPESLAKEFEDSLMLGCMAVQSQYDHDVRRFGETYARGDSIAREQMKDILITLQHAVISHLREVFMDDTALDLHSLKETSDDSRVNAIVCLGQLYQRMSTATAAMKQMSRPYLDEPDKVQQPASLAYSSSRSTHSSTGGRPLDSPSGTSYTTYSSRTAVVRDRRPSGGPPPQRRISLNSAFSYSSERDQPKSRTPGEDNIPELPLPIQRQTSQATADSIHTATSDQFHQPENRAHTPNVAAPPPYKSNTPIPVHVSDEKGQSYLQEKRPPHQLAAPAEVHDSLPQSLPRQQSPQTVGDADLSLQRPPARFQVHELDNSPSPADALQRDQQLPIPRSPPPGERQNVPLNPEYSTLEYVQALDARSRAPGPQMSDRPYPQYVQPVHPQIPHPQQSLQYGYYNYPMPQGSPMTMPPIPRPQTTHVGTAPITAPVDPMLQQRVPTIHSSSRPLSIRSTASASSRVQSFVLRKALPPGIAEAIQKPAPSPLEAQYNSQPRYVKPSRLDLNQAQNAVHGHGPMSPTSQRLDSMSDEVTATSTSDTVSLESTMRAPASSPGQVARSQLNFPNEGNLVGFCKGAVRQQLGAKKKGFSLEHRKGAKGLEYFFRCTKCNFEGPAAVSTALPSGGRGAVKRDKTFDPQVRISEGGIKYRWVFLAKCHVQKKLAVNDALNRGDMYACYFCCAEGAAKGWVDDTLSAQLAMLGTFGDKKSTLSSTPTFSGLAAFMAHLETHRISSRTPGLIVANEMNCIVGRVAHDHEDFDLNLPPLGA